MTTHHNRNHNHSYETSFEPKNGSRYDRYRNKWDNFYAFLTSDYSQIEVRILAEVSQDAQLLRDFELGEDIHCVVGHRLTGYSIEAIKKDKKLRTKIKAIHFAIIYGKDPFGVHKDLVNQGIDITLEEVEENFRMYFLRYEGVAQYIKDSRKYTEEHGKTKTIFGFEREINTTAREEGHSSWRNQAINSPIQGAAHQLLLIGMAALKSRPKDFPHLIGKLLMEVHDELTFRVKLKYLKKAYKEVMFLMQEAIPQQIRKWFKFKLKVPLVADAKAGFRRGVLVDYKGQSTESFIKAWRKENIVVEGMVYRSFKKKYGIKIDSLHHSYSKMKEWEKAKSA